MPIGSALRNEEKFQLDNPKIPTVAQSILAFHCTVNAGIPACAGMTMNFQNKFTLQGKSVQ